MKKELKDYLHLYLGCECITPDGVLILNGLNINDSRNQVWFYCRWSDSKNCYLPKRNAEILGKQSLVGKAFKYSEIKPILRPLSDMTEIEENKLAELCLGNDDFIITYRGMGYDFDGHEIHESVKCLKVEIFCEHPKINNWIPFALIQVDYTDDRSPIILGRFEELGKELKDDLLENNFELTRYLLSKRFDLFGLIESGLAVNAVELKTVNE